MIVFGIIGLLLISYAIWQKNESRQDAIFVLGGSSLLAYSFSIGDYIFIVLQIVFILSSVLELRKLNRK